MPPWIVRAASLLVLAAHVALGVAALLLLPRGFGLGELHAWTNTIVPLVAVVVTGAVLLARLFSPRFDAATNVLVAMAAGGWCAAIVTGALLFPKSVTLPRLIPLVIFAMLLVALLASMPRRRAFFAFALGAPLGVPLILAQRAPLPSTQPAIGEVVGTVDGDRTLSVACGSHTLQLAPLLHFESRSPDRTWTVLAPTHDAVPAEPRTLVTNQEQPDVFAIDGRTQLPQPVYSHLNSFSTLAFSFDATVTFSPTAPLRTAIEPADYPAGRPMQLAYVDADEIFHVVRARDAEKGPFSELARGPLRRGENLTIEIRPTAANERGCSVTFADWSAQLSTAPSPTAGFGVPVNSIQFFSNGRASLILLTLADTGPGRGFDSVGHAAGVYRNRIRVSPLPP